MFQSNGWSTKAVTVFVDIGGIAKALPEITVWGFANVSFRAVLTYIAECGKCMRPCVLLMTTVLFLIKSNPIIGPATFFITTKCSAKTLSPISNLGVAVDIGFSNWPLATCI